MLPILLISDQTLPNLLFLKQFGPFERYVFITTGKMELGGQSRWIAQTAGIPGEQILLRVVDPEQPGSTQAALSSLDLPPDEPVTAYITGGTKMMSLGAYAWASRRPAAQIFYLPIGGRQFLRIFPDAAEIPLTAQVSLEEYLAVHGVQVLSKGDWHGRLLEAERVFRHVSDQAPDPAIGHKLAWSRAKGVSGATPQDKADLAFYSGEWLEVWMAAQIQQLLQLPAHHVYQGVKVNKTGVSSPYDNEYDVMFVRGSRLFLGECKHFTAPKRRSISDIRKELYKLAGSSNLLGLYARPFLAIIQQTGGMHEDFIYEGNRQSWEELSRLLRIPDPAGIRVLADRQRLADYLTSL
jgi:hypothetical protein